jgi:hypothetical protein
MAAPAIHALFEAFGGLELGELVGADCDPALVLVEFAEDVSGTDASGYPLERARDWRAANLDAGWPVDTREEQ